MAHREPAPVGQFADQQDLCFATRAPGPGSRDPDTAQSGRDHARHVEHEHILRRNERDDIAEVGVPQSAARAIEYEQAAGGTVGERVLGYLSRWQTVVEVRGSVEHAENCGLRIVDCGLDARPSNPQSEIRNPHFAYPSTTAYWSADLGAVTP